MDHRHEAGDDVEGNGKTKDPASTPGEFLYTAGDPRGC